MFRVQPKKLSDEIFEQLKEHELEKLISIVIPAKNEELFIARCIEGAIKALKNFESWEIILVDSYSDDNTIEIAKNYPVRILRLKKNWFKSPHAGRYIGTINSFGKYIFFLDADMIVEAGWIETALNILGSDEKLAGITGVMYNVYPNEKLNKNHKTKGKIGYVDYLPGPSVYKRSVLFEVDHFNPYLKGNGEREIGHRISGSGYRQIRVDKTICYHCKKEYNINESIEKASYFIGVGQFLRLHFNKKNLIETVIRYKNVFIYFTILQILIVLFFIALIVENLKLLLCPLSFLIICLFIVIAWKGPKKVILIMNGLTISMFNFFYGYIKTTNKKKDYPLNVEIIN